jgi:hypothetical protein
MMIAALVSPAEVDELLVEISSASFKDPSVTFEFRRQSHGTDRESMDARGVPYHAKGNHLNDEDTDNADACQSEGSGDEDRLGGNSDDDNRGSLLPSGIWSRVNRL